MIHRKKWNAATVGLAGCAAALSCMAESYDAWLAGVPQERPALIEFVPSSTNAVRSTTTIRVRSRHGAQDRAANQLEIPQRPSGGWIGDVRIKTVTATALRLPLSLRVIYSQVLARDLRPPQGGKEDPKYFWHQPSDLLNRAAPIRVVRFTEQTTLPASPAGTAPVLPVLLPALNRRDSSGFLEFDESVQSMMSVRAELCDAEGRVADRRLLVELCDTRDDGYETEAWVTEDAEADRVLRERCRIRSIRSVDRLPPMIAPYLDVNALWVSAPAWQRQPLDAVLLRRLVLAGRWVYGRPETVEVITRAAGLDCPQRVLLGGIAAPARTGEVSTPPDNSHEYGVPPQSTTLADSNSSHSKTNVAATLENNRELFAPHKRRFLNWTVSVLGVFGAIIAVGLPLAFYRFKGARRLMLWWLAPGVAGVCALAGWIGGNVVLPRELQADVTEFRMAYAPWPEVYCHTVARALNFEQRDLAWQMPAGSIALPHSAWRPVCQAMHVTQAPEGNSVQLAGLRRGGIETVESLCFRTLPLPVKTEWSGNKPLLRSLQALRNVHVWHEGAMHKVGSLAAGATVDPATCGKTDGVAGLPRRFDAMLEAIGLRPTCCDRHKAEYDRKLKERRPREKMWIVMAVSDEVPATRVAPAAQTQGRVAWIIQLPLVPPEQPGGRRGPE